MDDLHPAHLAAQGLRPVAAAVLVAPEGRSPLAVSPRVTAFVHAPARDAAARWVDACPTEAPTADGAAVLAWARAAGLEQIVVPRAPTDPLRDAVDRIERAVGIPVVRPLRDWDAAAWPHAGAEYFRSKGRVAAILETVAEG